MRARKKYYDAWLKNISFYIIQSTSEVIRTLSLRIGALQTIAVVVVIIIIFFSENTLKYCMECSYTKKL